MLTSERIRLLLVLWVVVSVVAPAAVCEPAKPSSEEAQPHEIGADIQRKAEDPSNVEEQRLYLESVLLDEESSVPAKASAIRLLGELSKPSSVRVLISNIEFRDPNDGAYPAVEALADIGDPSVQPLLEVVASRRSKERSSLAVQALMMIKGDQYQEFVERQRHRLPEDAWKDLLRYAIVD